MVRIAGIHYLPVIDAFLEQKPEFKNKPYEDQLQSLFQYSPIYSDGFSRSFRELGQEAVELVVDFDIIQKQWAKENGIQYTPENWMFDILMAQIKTIKPDVIYFQGTEWTIPGRFSPDRNNDNLIRILKEAYPFIKKVIIFSGYPSPLNRLYNADFLFLTGPHILSFYKIQGLDSYMPSELMYHSFDDSILQKLNQTGERHDFSFAGMSRAPESRYWALRELMEQTELKGWIYEPPHETDGKVPKKAIKQQIRGALKRGIQLLSDHQVNALADSNLVPEKFRDIFLEISSQRRMSEGIMLPKGPTPALSELYPERCHPPVMGMDMYNLLHQSKITFNKHADLARGNVGNMRMFEATGVGTCLLTDNGSNMQDLFEPDKEVVVYYSVDEAVEKVTYLLDHPGEAEQIAKAGQARTLRNHTIMNRCQQIDEVIQKNL